MLLSWLCRFKGVIIKERHYGDISVEDFSKRLEASLKVWKAAGKRGVWLRILISQSEFIPVAAKVGPRAILILKDLLDQATLYG